MSLISKRITLSFIILASILTIGHKSYAQEDVTPPQITAFNITPTTFNTEFSDQILTLNITLTDDITGVCISGDCGVQPLGYTPCQVVLKPVSGTKNVTFYNLIRISGDKFDGTYTATATVPQWYPVGAWEIENIVLADQIGNMQYLYKADIESQFGVGSADLFNSATVEEVSAPQVTAFNIAPSTFNTESSDQVLTLNITLTDDASGVCIDGDCGVQPLGYTPSQLSIKPLSSTKDVTFLNLTRTSGDKLNGTYTATATIPRWYPSGAWEVQDLVLADQFGNIHYLYKADIEALFGVGSADLMNLASVEEVTPPQVTAFNITPTTFNTESSDQVLTLNITLEDDLSGVCISGDCGVQPSGYTPCSVVLKPVIGTQEATFYDLIRTSGDSLVGTYSSTVTIPAHAKEGIWEVDKVVLADKLGNIDYLYKSDIESQFGKGSATIVNKAEAIAVEVEVAWDFNSEAGESTATFNPNTSVTEKQGNKFGFYQLVNESLSASHEDGTPLKVLKFGIPGIGLGFTNAVDVLMYVGDQYTDGQALRVFSLESGAFSWIEEFNCIVSQGFCSFSTTHASYFAFTLPDMPGSVSGRITSGGVGVPGALVSGGGKSQYTDGNGYYLLFLPSGSQTITVVRDGYQSTSFPVSISTGTNASAPLQDINSIPRITNFPPGLIKAYETYSFLPIVYEPDGDTYTFSITGKPVWANFNSTTGTLSGRPSNSDEGTHGPITITVTDSKGASSSVVFSIKVGKGDSFPLPAIILLLSNP